MTAPRRIVLAIDGPSGAGKSTVARALARRLGYLFLDTGAMYRAVALAFLKKGVGIADEEGATRLLAGLRLRFSDDGDRIFLWLLPEPEADVTAAIRAPEVTAVVSQVSALAIVREKLTAEQRAIAAGRSVVAEGRDTTTVVFPDAQRKFFLTARLEERARRRQAERPELRSVPVEQVAAEIRARDERDATRRIAPLTRAADAVVIDSSGMPLDDVVEAIARHCEQSA